MSQISLKNLPYFLQESELYDKLIENETSKIKK